MPQGTPIETDPFEALDEAVTPSLELVSPSRDVPRAEQDPKVAAPPPVVTNQEMRAAIQLLARYLARYAPSFVSTMRARIIGSSAQAGPAEPGIQLGRAYGRFFALGSQQVIEPPAGGMSGADPQFYQLMG
ncbi:hypothetical protein HAX54_040740 [Datura stramonium]|uniref:Uncharacterized protein n=1 Tax=Datura stramonium TaxID=4076 RepID=A0ABS8VRQ4_DATST|nr:hypothetical protein [Datura stramonium]